jgi:hypothetical protein
MPITRSEVFYFAAGVAVGAMARASYPQLKEKFGPLLASALAGVSSAVGESYSELAKRVGEKVESVQDAMAEMKINPGAAENEPAETATASA